MKKRKVKSKMRKRKYVTLELDDWLVCSYLEYIQNLLIEQTFLHEDIYGETRLQDYLQCYFDYKLNEFSLSKRVEYAISEYDEDEEA